LDYIILIFLYIELNVYIRGTLIVNSDIKKNSVYSFIYLTVCISQPIKIDVNHGVIVI